MLSSNDLKVHWARTWDLENSKEYLSIIATCFRTNSSWKSPFLISTPCTKPNVVLRAMGKTCSTSGDKNEAGLSWEREGWHGFHPWLV